MFDDAPGDERQRPLNVICVQPLELPGFTAYEFDSQFAGLVRYHPVQSGLAQSSRLVFPVDVLLIRGIEMAAAYRTRISPGGDVWHPEYVVWHVVGTTVDVLAALRELDPSEKMSAPYRTPAECIAPPGAPSSCRAGVW